MTDSLREALEDNPFDGFRPSAALASPLQTFNRGKVFLLLAAILGVGTLYWLAIVVLSGSSLAFDVAVPRYLHRYADARLDRIASIVCMLVTVISIFVLALLLYRRWWRQALFWFCSTAGAAILCGLLKNIMQRHRPDLWILASHHASFSFPSGHAAQSMAIVVALLLLAGPARRGRLLIFGAAFIGLVGVCRIYLGLHYPTDILAGWALSLSWVCLLGALSGAQSRRPD
jgi:membrane-associated phospholipid phosphatase